MLLKLVFLHLMDATPLAWDRNSVVTFLNFEHGIKAIENTLPASGRAGSQGTAVGTGLNTPKGYDVTVAKYIAEFWVYLL